MTDRSEINLKRGRRDFCVRKQVHTLGRQIVKLPITGRQIH